VYSYKNIEMRTQGQEEDRGKVCQVREEEGWSKERTEIKIDE
jgi:hypothetical protein